MIEEQKNKNTIQMLYYVIKTYDTGLSKEDIDSLDIIQQENTILKQNAKHNDKVVDKVNWDNNLLKQQLKDKDEKISNLIKLLVEMVFDDINDLGVYQELVARHLVKLGYIVKEDGLYKELKSNKED